VKAAAKPAPAKVQAQKVVAKPSKPTSAAKPATAVSPKPAAQPLAAKPAAPKPAPAPKPAAESSHTGLSWSESLRKAMQDKHTSSGPEHDKSDWKNRQRSGLSIAHRNKYG
jgi:hypothetical protein